MVRAELQAQRHRRRLRPAVYLAFLNSQWLHIFWITDEFVVASGSEERTILPGWLAYVAILIDYLELPVMWDTIKRVVLSRRADRGYPLRP